MQIQWWEGAASSCAKAVPQSATRDSMSPEGWLLRKRIVKSVIEEAGKGTPFRGKAQRYGARRNTQRIRIGERRFMPQP